jgi:prepilin-type N-terminal cleavage/methylation domain-containing protein
MASRRQHGFSLIELMLVIGISLTLAAITAVTMQTAIHRSHVDMSYNLTLNYLRRARDLAAGDMRTYIVTFSPAVAPLSGGTINAVDPSTGVVLFNETLPPDVTFNVTPGLPNTAATTPDGFGTASNGPFDFDWGSAGATGGSNVIYFYPDGSAHDAAGNTNNGVVYLSIPGNLNTARAVSLWGYTGRIRGWQLYQIGGVWTWQQR